MIHVRYFFTLLFTVCCLNIGSAGAKYYKTKIDQKNFIETISIETQLNLMFTMVEIDGKKYKFLIDTGAPFAISPELAAKIDFKLRGNDTMRSSNSKRGVQQWGVVKKVKIGNIGFSRITTFVIDFRKSDVLACLDFDGIIGSNLMNTCIWQFRHDEKKAIFTDDISRLKDRSVTPQKIKQVGRQKAPYVVCKVNKGDNTYVLFDTGSGDFFDLKYSIYNNAKKAGKLDPEIEVVTGRGLGASGIYGAIDTTKFMVKLPKLVIAGEEIERVVTDMSITSKSKVGIRFAKGRVLTFDFPNQQLYIHNLPNQNIERQFKNFGFSLYPDKEGTIVGSIWHGSSAEEMAVPKYAKVLSLNKLDFISQKDKCKLTFGASEILRDTDTIDLKVLVEGEEKDFKLTKRDLFETSIDNEH